MTTEQFGTGAGQYRQAFVGNLGPALPGRTRVVVVRSAPHPQLRSAPGAYGSLEHFAANQLAGLSVARRQSTAQTRARGQAAGAETHPSATPRSRLRGRCRRRSEVPENVMRGPRYAARAATSASGARSSRRRSACRRHSVGSQSDCLRAVAPIRAADVATTTATKWRTPARNCLLWTSSGIGL
jgi:hypothetical protein